MDVGTGKWKTDVPKNPGWYNASAFHTEIALRWWDGIEWSMCCFPTDSKNDAAKIAKIHTQAGEINWRPLKMKYRRP